MSSQTKFAGPLILFLMPVLFSLGIESISYETRRFAVLPAGKVGKSGNTSPVKQESNKSQDDNTVPASASDGVSEETTPETAKENEDTTVETPDAAKQNENISIETSATSGQKDTGENINPAGPPAVEVAVEIPPKALPSIRINQR